MTSGRIIDFAVDPDDPATWFVASAGGGVWKTTRIGFVIYASYSTTQAPGEAQREARLEAAGAPFTPNRRRGG